MSKKKKLVLKRWAPLENHVKLVLVLCFIGLVSLFLVFIGLFTPLGDNTPSPKVTVSFTLSDLNLFEEALSASINSSIEQGGPVTILTNGAEFLPDLLKEIKNAKKSINITNFIWDDDEFGNTLFRALIERAKEGVGVRILLDGVGSISASDKYTEELRQAGGQVAFFRPLRWWNINRANQRNHLREFVIDGQTAYIGGIAISELWLGDADTEKSWHDYMFKMHAEMAETSQEIFGSLWSQTTGEILAGPDFYPHPEMAAAKADPSRHFISFFSNPTSDLYSNMEHFLWLSIHGAEHSIHIENPYLLPNKSVLEALKNKAKAGVEVELILPCAKTDAPYVRWASRSFYTELLDAGVKIFEYQPSRFHAKIITIDGKWSIIGSANLDNRSSQLNLESIMGIYDVSFAEDLEAKFEEDKKNSKEITKEKWKTHLRILAPLEQFSRFFIKQY